MKKIAAILLLVVIIIAALLFPFINKETTIVKTPFFNTYTQLTKAENWEKWRPDLNNQYLKHPGKVITQTASNHFNISTPTVHIAAAISGSGLNITEEQQGKTMSYSYFIFPGKHPDETLVTVAQKSNMLNGLLQSASSAPSPKARLLLFKHFMETPELYYGYKIDKVPVTDSNIIVYRHSTNIQNMLHEAHHMLDGLNQFLAKNHLKQNQPLIAQFLPKSHDSIQINIGMPVNKKIPPAPPILFMSMPSGPGRFVYTANFKGRFKDRLKAYNALQQYFNDKHLQVPVLPFETFLDNKLPQTDTDEVRIRFNFPTY